LWLSYWLAERSGSISYFLRKRERASARENIQQVLGSNAKVDAKTKVCFQNFAKYVVDFFRFPIISKENLNEFITIEGKENLEEALGYGKGVVALSAHLGHFELAGAALALLGYKINAVSLRQPNPYIDKLFIGQREKCGVKGISFDSAAIECYRALRKGEIVALLGDRDIMGQGIKAFFFGKETTVPRGPVSLAILTGAPILPGFAVRGKNNKFCLFIEKPFFVPKTGNKERDEIEATKKVIGVMEIYISRYVEQWGMFHRIWERDGKNS
jgi:KDO2-lipid IV(A) lauroyltransferase